MSRPGPLQTLMIWCCALALTVSACTGADPSEDASEAAQVPGEVPEIPAVEEIGPSAPPSPSPATAAPSPRPRPGEHVLADLEGPIADREATDVVLRTQRGVELDRFRLSGAVDVHAQPGGRWGMVSTLTGQWARLDARGPSLTLVPFAGAAPVGAPDISGALAWWDDPEDTWLLRLDEGEPRRVRELLDEAAEVVAVSDDGRHALLRGSRTVVLDTDDWQVRETVQTDRIAMGADGTVAAVTARDGEAILVVQVPGEDSRDLAILPGLGMPVPLPDGRVAVLGGDSALVTLEGTASALPTAVIRGQPVVSTDGRVVLGATDDGLIVVDISAATATTLPGTQGFVPHDQASSRWLWALSGDGEDGAAVIDVESAEGTLLLDDRPTSAITSMTADGAVAAIRSGPAGSTTVVATADGSVAPRVIGADAIEVALHPSGAGAAVAVVQDGTRSVLLGDLDQPQTRLETARNPVWLRTGEN